MNQINKLNKYFTGKLTEKDTDDLTKEIIGKQYDTELKNKWNELLTSQHGYQAPTLNEEEISVEDNSSNTKPATGKIRQMYKVLAFAASILLIVGLGFMNFPNSSSTSNQLATNYLSQPFAYSETRKGATDLNEKRLTAGELYSQRAYGHSAKIYTKIVSSSESNNVDLFYLALSELYNDNAQNSIPHFKSLINGLDDNFKNESSWFLSLAYLKTAQPEKAKEILDTISNWDKSTSARAWDKKMALQAKALLETM